MSQSAKQQAFDLLGVTPADDAATIRKAWRVLVRTYHPDTFQGDKAAANARLARLNAAFDALRDHVPPGRDFAARAAARAAAMREARAAEAERAAKARDTAEAAARAEEGRRAEARRRAEAARRAEAERLAAEAARRAEEARETRAPRRSLSEMRATQAAQATFEAARKAFQDAAARRAEAIRAIYA